MKSLFKRFFDKTKGVDMRNHNDRKNYLKLAIMAVLSFAFMYVLMYAMVNVFANVYPNLNQFYMAGLMAAPMVIIEVLLMKAMYGNKKWNATVIVSGIVIMIAFWISIRQQSLVRDEQLLKSMIPHHAGAILMCEKAEIKNSEVKDLCESIKTSQLKEIDQMKNILNKLGE